jgi:non-specific serine/threonine protein kinase
VPARQQTLRSTIDWSFNLLNNSEKQLFARLAVFRGGRSLEAIEAVCANALPDDVFDTLTGLLDKNLIYRQDSPVGEPRFWLLETIHEYAWEQLDASGKAETIRRHHAEYFVDLAERAEPELRLARQYHWGQILEADADNLRAVLDWSLDGGDITLGARLAGALQRFWFSHGHHAEGLTWTRRFLEHLERIPAQYHARLLICAGWMHVFDDLNQASFMFRQALEAAQKTGDKSQIAPAMAFLGYSLMENDPDVAITLAEESLALARELDHRPTMVDALVAIGEISRFAGDDHRARISYKESLALAEQLGDLRGIHVNMTNRAFIAQHEGDYTHAADLHFQVLRFSREMHNRSDMAACLGNLCVAKAMIGPPEQVAKLFGAAEASMERLGTFIEPSDQPEIDHAIASLRAKLGDAAFNAAYAIGRKIPLDQAVAEALGETSDEPTSYP